MLRIQIDECGCIVETRFMKIDRAVFIFLVLHTGFLAAKTQVDSRLQFHQVPNSLSTTAIVEDWPRFNGAKDDACSAETNLDLSWSKNGPTLLWEVEKGDGYSSPAVKNGILVLFHRLEGKETIEGRDAENGNLLWTYSYPVDYRDRYGYLNGPRASPVIQGNLVYALGVTAWLTCLEFKTGKVVWKRNLRKEFGIPQNFFGKGSNPLAVGDCLVINIGGSNNRSVIGLDFKSGQTNWVTLDEWGASYSSPRIAKIHDREVILVFAGGESRPPNGGLIVIDPRDGKKLSRFPWRSKSYESVNAVPPVPLGNNRVYLSECYEKGSVVLSFDPNFNASILWENSDLNIHWMTPVTSGTLLYGISGRHQRGAQLFCIDHGKGELLWREPVSWTHQMDGRTLQLQLFRGSILKVGTTGEDFIGLSELGSLVSMKLSSKGWKLEAQTQLFFSSGTWTLPALSRGMLYIMQNEVDRITGKGSRLLCYDLRKK